MTNLDNAKTQAAVFAAAQKADEALLKVTDEHVWGEAMTALIAAVREGRAGDGICAAIERVGVVLEEHFPRSAGDINEIPDKLIEL